MQRNKIKAAPAIDTRPSTKEFQQHRGAMAQAVEASDHSDGARIIEAPTAMSNLAYQIEQLEKAVEVLAGRLHPVLSHKPTAGLNGDAPEFNAPLFQGINIHTERLRSVNGHIEYLLASLEV